MAIVVNCPNCRKRVTAPADQAGQSKQCPYCGKNFPLPSTKTNVWKGAVTASHPGEEQDEGLHFSHKANTPLQDLIDMTAMVDIVFFLLIYFLVTSLCNLHAAVNAPSPEAKLGRTAKSSGSSVETGESLTVRIDEDDNMWFDEDQIPNTIQLGVRLRKSREESEIDRLRIAASADATHGTVIKVMDAGIAAGMRQVQLAVQESP